MLSWYTAQLTTPLFSIRMGEGGRNTSKIMISFVFAVFISSPSFRRSSVPLILLMNKNRKHNFATEIRLQVLIVYFVRQNPIWMYAKLIMNTNYYNSTNVWWVFVKCNLFILCICIRKKVTKNGCD